MGPWLRSGRGSMINDALLRTAALEAGTRDAALRRPTAGGEAGGHQWHRRLMPLNRVSLTVSDRERSAVLPTELSYPSRKRSASTTALLCCSSRAA
jgi:hypothetical protein